WQESREHDNYSAAKFAAGSSRSSNLAGMLKLAAAELPATSGMFDRNPMLLNVANGTLDLSTGELRPHDRDDYFTRIAPTEYDPDASTEAWERFIAGILPDPSIAGFVRRLFGYFLTGSVQEQVLPVFFGEGCNG